MSDVETTDDESTETEEAAAPAVEETVAPVESASSTDSSASEDEASRENPRKVREGIVVSIGMDKTAVIEATDRVRHRRYAKTVQRSTKLFAHDEENDARLGDRVRIQETRPLSKKKRWRLVEIIERAR